MSKEKFIPHASFLVLFFFVSLSCANSKSHDESKDPKVACEERGGKWTKAGFANAFSCITPYKDAGKTCNDSSECEGKCAILESNIAAGTKISGTCSINDSPFGCYALINDGIADYTICVD